MWAGDHFYSVPLPVPVLLLSGQIPRNQTEKKVGTAHAVLAPKKFWANATDADSETDVFGFVWNAHKFMEPAH